MRAGLLALVLALPAGAEPPTPEVTRLQAQVAQSPDDWTARSDLGLALLRAGRTQDARAQLTAIRTQGGRGTWAELRLRQALDSSSGYAY